ncbi:MAG TPA: hypothetical protein VHC47_06485 [Mucilaginibacter sp.]|nr:hypothetical protein [Mucilaginibacter sp.]
MKTFLLNTIILIFIIPFCSCHINTPKSDLTKEIVEKTIQESLYPASNNSDISKTTLEFHSVNIASPHTLGVDEVYGIPAGTTINPVLVSFTSTNRTQDDPKGQALYDTHDITQKYLFYKDEFGKWVLDIVSSSDNRDVEKRWWSK